VFSGTYFVITKAIFTVASGAYGTACVGGIYNATSKPAGGKLSSSSQSFAALTGVLKIVDADIATGTVTGTAAQSAATIYLSLTTGNTGALSALITVYGAILL